MDIEQYVTRPETQEESDPDWGHVQWVDKRSLTGQDQLTVGHITMQPGRNHPEHRHPNCAETLYVLAGTFRHTLGDEETVLETGDCLHIPRDVVHLSEAISDEPAEAIIAYDTGSMESVHTADE